MKRILGHLAKFIVRGLIVIAPLALSALAVHFLYVTIDRPIATLGKRLIGHRIPGLGVLSVLFVLYLLGLIASNVIGRQALSLFRSLVNHIPFLRAIYHVGEQIGSALSLPDKQAFKRVVLVEYLKPGIWTVGFVTGSLHDKQTAGEKVLKVFIPTPPNPATGTMVLVRESQTRDPGWTMEEGLRTVISGGIIGPSEIEM